MLFVALMDVRAGTAAERLAHRLKWDVPDEVKVVGEYWLMTSDPEVIFVFEADGFASMLGFVSDWDDLFDISIFPAASASDGMEMAMKMLNG